MKLFETEPEILWLTRFTARVAAQAVFKGAV
jgi:hypothetical protein